MAASLSGGHVNWSMTRNEVGHREYTIEWLVIADRADGPAVVMECPGLPAIGSYWDFDNDVDVWAYCTPRMTVTPKVVDEANVHWKVTQVFSTSAGDRDQTDPVGDPLLELDRVSGSFTKYTKEATRDSSGDPITNSSYEIIRGAIVERDFNRPTVRIEKNLAALPLSTFAPMIDTLNDATLWGLPPRCVKLSNVSWERKVTGAFTFFYVVAYEFDIDYDTFDKTMLDEGTKILAPGGTAGKPEDYIVYKDLTDENSTILLDGNGHKWDGTGSPGILLIELYPETNFSVLNLPSGF